MTDETNAVPDLDQSIANAQGLITVLGIVFLIASIAQALGWVQAGVPASLNIAIAVAVLGLAQLLPKKSLAVTAALGAIFIVLAVDTLMATGYVLDSWGIVPTIIVVVRYLILINAAHHLAEVGKLLWAERTTAERLARLQGTDSPASALQDSPAAEAQAPREMPAGALFIDVSNNSAAMFFKVFSGFLVAGGLIGGSAMLSFGETGVAMIAIFGFAGLAYGCYYLAGMEERFLPGLVVDLRKLLEQGETDGLDEIRTKLIATKQRGSRQLAAEIVNNRIPADSAFAEVAAEIIAEIGSLDGDAAYALKRVLGDSHKSAQTLGKLLPAGE